MALQSKVLSIPSSNSSWRLLLFRLYFHKLISDLSRGKKHDNMLRGVGGGAQVYLLRPLYLSRWLQWLQWWLGGEEGSRLLLIKPCKCKMQAQHKSSSCWPDEIYIHSHAAKLSRVPCINRRENQHQSGIRK